MYEATMLLITVAGIQLVALVTPGPDFFLISQVAVSHSRRDAMMAVIGVTIGVAVWALVALLGLHVLVKKLPWIQAILYLAGGSYLSYLGSLLMRSCFAQLHRKRNQGSQVISDSNVPTVEIEKQYKNRLLLKGLFTNLANPKALIYFGSVFVLFVGDNVSNVMRVEIFVLVTALTLLWFGVVAIVFSLPKPKALYQRAGAYIDGFAGILFLVFGLSLVYEAIMMLIL